VREDECCNSYDEEQAQLIGRKKCNEETRQQEEGERAKEKHSSDKSPLLADRGENVVVMHGGRRQKAKLTRSQ